ncbi:MAG: galactokinase [Holophagales bacterium]|jgi:D-glycero-alpha-D-manno-heptose-7-phosphate kinase|nr:galactokinase [Holophagales bacterium]
MIVVRSPLRLSLGGGGTDLPSFSRREGGALVAAAIDKYVYVTLHRTFEPGLIVKYSSVERAASREEIRHPIVREALKLVGIDETDLEIASMADIPAGTGLGSSGSFTTALLAALHALRGNDVAPALLAEQACEIEMVRLGEPVGRQDPYIAAHGGVTAFAFAEDDRVAVSPVPLSRDAWTRLEEGLVLIFTGFSRSASAVLKEQDDRSRSEDPEMLGNLRVVKEIGQRSRAVLEAGDVEGLGRLMNEHWEWKKRRSAAMSNPAIDAWYELALGNGALGGKLVGAGGGGFLLFCCVDRPRLRAALGGTGLREVPFRFEREGTRVLLR